MLEVSRLTTAGGRDWLWAGTEGRGLWVSEDDGGSWRHAGLDGQAVYDATVNPTGRIIAATDDGLFAPAQRSHFR